MRISFEQDPALLELASQRLGLDLRSNTVTISAWSDTGDLLGVVLFNHFCGTNIELSIWTASPKWCSRRFLHTCFNYVFNRCGCRRCSILVRTTNNKMLDLAERLGFQREGLVREAFEDGSDGVLLGMLRAECVWLLKRPVAAQAKK
jgi:RimJ/RimL family protein N-acetyltransferase